MTLNSFKKVNNGTKYLQGIQLFTYSQGNANIGKCWRYPMKIEHEEMVQQGGCKE